MAWKNNEPKLITKCFTCQNATGKTACSWAKNFTPVEGWTAEESVISPGYAFEEKSYLVYACPLYRRGDGDLEWGSGDYRRLLICILYQAVIDWKALNYGAIDSLRYKGEIIKREDLVHFFHSKYFEWLVRMTVNVDSDKIRAALKIPEGEVCVI